VREGGYAADLIDSQADADSERLEVRRVIFENVDFLNNLYGYYRADMNEDWSHDRKIPGQEMHNGREVLDDDEEHLLLEGMWRILKECKIVCGDVKSKLPIAVFNRVHVQGKRRIAKLTAKAPDYNVLSHDPHYRALPVPYYDFIETLIRISYIRCSGSLSERFEDLITKFLKEHAMKRQAERFFLDFRSTAVQAVLHEPSSEGKLRKVFDYFVTTYKSSKLRTSVVGAQDLSMSLNHVLVMQEKMDMFDPSFNVKRCAEMFAKIVVDSDLLPQEHPNNANSEMIFNEYLDFLMRTARAKNSSKDTTADVVKKFISEEIIPKAARLLPGKL